MFRQLSLLTVLITLASPVFAAGTSLFDIYTQALEADPRVQIAQQKVELGKAQADSAFGALLPQASASASFSDNEVSYADDRVADQSYNGERYSIQVRQMLFNWRTISSRARSKQVLAQRESELLDVMSLLLLDVSERYFRVLLAQGDMGLKQAEMDLVQQQLRETDELYQRKLVRITDYLETRARADRVRTDLIEAENNVALARESLSELTGTYVGELAPIKEDFRLPQLENTMEYWTALATANNDLLASKHMAVLAAEEAVQEQKGGHYPTVDLVLSGQQSDVGYDNQASPKRDTQYVGIDINLPLYSGGSTSARVREAWAQYYIAREEEEGVRREVLKRTREAWLNTRSSRKRIDAANLSVESAVKSYEAMSKSFTYGTVTATDVLEALRGQTLAQRDYQDALYSYLVNWMALKRESGDLDAEDLRQLDDWLISDNS
jgi:outer membrane protein